MPSDESIRDDGTEIWWVRDGWGAPYRPVRMTRADISEYRLRRARSDLWMAVGLIIVSVASPLVAWLVVVGA